MNAFIESKRIGLYRTANGWLLRPHENSTQLGLTEIGKCAVFESVESLSHAFRQLDPEKVVSRVPTTGDKRKIPLGVRKANRKARIDFVRSHLNLNDDEMAKAIRHLYSPSTYVLDIRGFVGAMRKRVLAESEP